MDAKRLAELGFVKWRKMYRLSAGVLPVREKIVFVIMERTSGDEAPSVLYVGRTGRPLRRILGGYIAGSGRRKAKQIHKQLLEGDLLSRAEISWKVSENTKAERRNLLAEFKSVSRTLPPWNRSLRGAGLTSSAKKAQPTELDTT